MVSIISRVISIMNAFNPTFKVLMLNEEHLSPFYHNPDEETAVRTVNSDTQKEVSPRLLLLCSGTKKLCEQQRAYQCSALC